MKLVDAETHGPDEEHVLEEEGPAIPPRPEHRRVSVSLLFTLFVLSATVVTVYVMVPERHNALMTTAIEAHQGEVDYELTSPTASELRAWGIALLGRDVSWPEAGPGVEIVGAHSTEILNRPAAIVNYRIDGELVSLVVQRPRDAVPRTYRRTVGELWCVSWRRDSFTYTAVGPAAQERWKDLLGAPR